MKSASIHDIKTALKSKTPQELTELCLRLARFKKENKELLTFLLFEADDLSAYIDAVKKELDAEAEGINTGNLHWVKKSLRKLLRILNRHIRYTGSKTAEVELRLYFCHLLKNFRVSVFKSPAMFNLYHSQLRKIETVFSSLHEDLQRDYQLQVDALKER